MKGYKELLLAEFKRLKIKNWSITKIPRGVAIQLPDHEKVEDMLTSFPSIVVSAVNKVGKPKAPVEIRIFNNKSVSRYNLNPPSIPDTIENLN
ncbi:MAG: hypothetical protein JWN56_646 [Sphingobacteriales bacterium]|nr:hypothetical protein [Sphingobacteriales bacterium]